MMALRVENLAGGYGTADRVVKGVSLCVGAGELVTVIGPNGAGKSTAFKLIAGLLRPAEGQVRIAGRDVAGLAARGLVESGLVFVPQERNIFGDLTVDENLEMGAFLAPASARARLSKIRGLFPLLAERGRSMGRTLSGGQRQLLAMGQALMADPRVLLLDEPTAGLSPQASAELFVTIRAIRDSGVAILMVEQNALEALKVSDRAYVLVDGRNRMEGEAGALAENPDIRRLFLGGRHAAA